MKKLITILILLTFIIACTPKSKEFVCGNDICEKDEIRTCPQDCKTPEPPTKYTYGAKFEPPEGKILHGMGQFEEGNINYLNILNKDIYPASELFFFAVEPERPWNWMQKHIKDYLNKQDSNQRIPQIGFHLHNLKIEDSQSDPYFAIDDEVVETSKYDSRIEDFAKILAEYKKPVFLRIGAEFSGSWNGYHPYYYPKAFRKVVNIMREQGADNVAFVWCYMPAAPDDFDVCNSKGCKWFPGNDVIDWYSLDLFGAEDFTEQDDNRKESNSKKTEKFLKMALIAGKPVVLAETSAIHQDITSDYQDGVNDWNEWFIPFFKFLESNPQIKAFYYINVDWTKVEPYKYQGWLQSEISINSYMSQEYVKEISKDKYLHVDEVHTLKDYSKYK